MKDAAKVHTIKGADLAALHRRAAQSGKDALYIVYFVNDDITATMKVTKGRP